MRTVCDDQYVLMPQYVRAYAYMYTTRTRRYDTTPIASRARRDDSPYDTYDDSACRIVRIVAARIVHARMYLHAYACQPKRESVETAHVAAAEAESEGNVTPKT